METAGLLGLKRNEEKDNEPSATLKAGSGHLGQEKGSGEDANRKAKICTSVSAFTSSNLEAETARGHAGSHLGERKKSVG